MILIRRVIANSTTTNGSRRCWNIRSISTLTTRSSLVESVASAGNLIPSKTTIVTTQTKRINSYDTYSNITNNISYQRRFRGGGNKRSRRHRRLQKKNNNYNENQNKTIMFQSLGCPRNLVDTEVMLGMVVSSSEDEHGDGDDNSDSASRSSTNLELTTNIEDADYLVVNTCGFLESAREESRTAIEDLIQTKKIGSKLLVTGCMVNLHKDEILKNYPQVDYVLGAGTVNRILEAIEILNKQDNDDNNNNNDTMINYDNNKSNDYKNDNIKNNKYDNNDDDYDGKNNNKKKGSKQLSKVFRNNDNNNEKSFLEQGDTPRFVSTPQHYAYLKIAEGCRKRCSFCIIPKIKGKLQSKPMNQIVQEFQALLERGATEIILIAQDLGDYGKDLKNEQMKLLLEQQQEQQQKEIKRKEEKTAVVTTTSTKMKQRRVKRGGLLVPLLKEILSSDERDFWLRLIYLYPDEITEELIDLMENDHRICRYLDMPIQHINDDILKLMKRTTTSKDIKHTIRQLRKRLPGIHIRTSLMVGFPGETDEQFQELLDFVYEYKLDNVGVFIYSNEELALSSRLSNHIPEDIKMDRYDRLMRAQLEVTKQRNQELIERVKQQQQQQQQQQKDNINNSNKYYSSLLQVVVEGIHPDHEDYIVGRYYGQCPDIDGQVIINDYMSALGGEYPIPGQRYSVEVTDYDNYDLIGRIVDVANQNC